MKVEGCSIQNLRKRDQKNLSEKTVTPVRLKLEVPKNVSSSGKHRGVHGVIDERKKGKTLRYVAKQSPMNVAP